FLPGRIPPSILIYAHLREHWDQAGFVFIKPVTQSLSIIFAWMLIVHQHLYGKTCRTDAQAPVTAFQSLSGRAIRAEFIFWKPQETIKVFGESCQRKQLY